MIRNIFLLLLVLVLLLALAGISILAATGNPPIFEKEWGTSGTGDSQFREPYGIAIDTCSNVYVADTVGAHTLWPPPTRLLCSLPLPELAGRSGALDPAPSAC